MFIIYLNKMSSAILKAGFILAASAGFFIINSGSVAKIVRASKDYVKKHRPKRKVNIEPEKLSTL